MIALLIVALALLGLAALHGQLALRVRELEDERAEERRREAGEREQALRPEVTGLGWGPISSGHISIVSLGPYLGGPPRPLPPCCLDGVIGCTVQHSHEGNTHRAPAPRSPDVPTYWQERL